MTLENRLRLAIVVLGMAAYAPALHTPFLYDDHILIEANPAIRTLSWAGVHQDVTSGIFDHPEGLAHFYRPLQVLSTQVEYALWKLNPLPYHLTNLLLHISNALLLNEFLILLGFEGLIAGLAAVFFVVHPIIVEDLLMVSGRGELMGLLGMLLSLFLCLRPSRLSRTLGVAAFLLALLSKESAGITPVLLAGAYFYKREPGSRYLILLPMAGVLGFYLVLRRQALGQFLPPLEPVLYGRFMLTAFPTVLARYARILAFPLDLHTDRLLSPIGSWWFLKTGGALALAVWIFGRGPRWARFSFAWYVLMFLPKVPLMILGSFMSDHWAYPALPAFTLALGWLLAADWNARTRIARGAIGCAGASLLITGVALTWINVATRNTDEKLYHSALRFTSSPGMKYNLARVLLRQHRPKEALPYFQSLSQQDPQDANLVRAVAAALWDDGRRAEAIETLTRHLRRYPDDATSRSMLQGLTPTR